MGSFRTGSPDLAIQPDLRRPTAFPAISRHRPDQGFTSLQRQGCHVRLGRLFASQRSAAEGKAVQCPSLQGRSCICPEQGASFAQAQRLRTGQQLGTRHQRRAFANCVDQPEAARHCSFCLAGNNTQAFRFAGGLSPHSGCLRCAYLSQPVLALDCLHSDNTQTLRGTCSGRH